MRFRRLGALRLLFLTASLAAPALAAADDRPKPLTAHEAGLLLDGDFASRAACERALADAQHRQDTMRRIDYRRLFAHGRCELRRGRYAIRMHWGNRLRATASPG
jgi:hypothetical protein